MTPDFAALSAKTSKRPTLGALIRVNANSDRNIFGLTRVNSLWVLLGVSLFLLFHRDDIDDPRALAAKFDIRPVKAIVGVQAQMATCYAHLIGVFPGKCDGRAMNHTLDRYNQDAGIVGSVARTTRRNNAADLARGMYEWPDGSMRSYAPPKVKLAQTIENRCFQTDPYSVGDRGLHRIDEPSSSFDDAVSMPRYLGYAARSATTFDTASRTDPAAATKGYLDERKAMIEVAHRFFGQPGLDRMQAEYARPEHGHVILAIRAQRTDWGIMSRYTPLERAELKLLTDAPGSFTSCEARRTTG